MDGKIYKVERIEGEYAYLSCDGEELFIAMALLPQNSDEGTLLKYENFEFSIV